MSTALQLTGCLCWFLIGLFVGGAAVFVWVWRMDERRDREWKAEFYGPVLESDVDPSSLVSSVQAVA